MSKLILVLSTSLRKNSNSEALADAFAKGAMEAGHTVQKVSLRKKTIGFCTGCFACQKNGSCIIRDDAVEIVRQMHDADVIVFATPVYWWGMSAQLKLIIDKCYCKGLHLKNKKVGVIVVGAARVGSIQYELISKQFQCMADYLFWDMLFIKSYSASDRADLSNNTDAIAELKELGSNLC